MRYALFVPLIVATAAGCATMQAAGTRSTEQILSAAGFHMEAADTPEKLADLQTAPARQVLPQTRDGKTAYVYRDPNGCHCLYVGGEPEYQQYQKLRLQKDIADEESNAALTQGWAPWGGWGPAGWGPGGWGTWRQWP
ncbi:MAG: hypothetical protein DMD78_29630 [Candidatus Rokuibacteriota bacterium]|nr:MAG: hypothetical protein DMD78_29630 [Candidatus Rokubacteria bacterium]